MVQQRVYIMNVTTTINLDQHEKKYTTNKRNPEMAKKVALLGLLALLVVIILGIALTVYFTSKKSKSKSDGEEPSEKKPELTFNADATKTINPREEDSGTQEGYAIEYAGGEAIDLTLSWTNGQGFEGVVNKLIFTRYVGDTKIQDDKITEKAGEIADNGSGSVTFSGTDVSDGVDTKGTNVIKAYFNEVNADNELASVEVEITEDDFDQVMTGEFSEIVIPVSIKEDSFKLEKTTTKTYYNLFLHTYDESTQLSVLGSWYTIKQNGDKYTFTGSTGKPLTLNGNTEFKIQKYQGSSILLRASDDKIYYDDGDNDGAYVSLDQMRTSTWKDAKFILTSRVASEFPTGQPTTEETMQNSEGHWTIADGEARITGQSKVVWKGADGKHNFIKNGKTNEWESQTVKAGDTGILLYQNKGGLTKNDVIRNIRKSDGTPNRTDLAYNWCIRKPGTSGKASVLKKTYPGAGSWTGSTIFDLCDND